MGSMTTDETDARRRTLANALAGLITDLDTQDMSAEALEARLRALAATNLREPAEPLETTPLTALASAVIITAAADTLAHALAQQAHAAGYTWTEIAEAGGYASAQAAHWRWGRSEPRDTELAEHFTALRERLTAGKTTATLLPAEARENLPRGPVWKSAAAMGRELGVDARTVRARAARGELEVRESTGPTGRNTSLYRLRSM